MISNGRSNRSVGVFHKRPFKVLVCLVTLWSFLFSTVSYDLAWAARTPLELTTVGSNRAGSPGVVKELHVDTFALPEYLGHVKDFWKSSSGKVILHIQDAHCNYYAQHKISEIIEYLNKQYGINTVNLEGGVRDYDLATFTGISDKAIRDKVSDYFVKEGLINGAEYFAINNPEKVTLWGVEDTKLYLDNLNIYRDSLKHKDEIEKHLKALTYILSNLKTKIYSPELLDLDNKYSQYKADKLPFKDYLANIIQAAKKNAIDIKSFTNIYLLNQTLGEEANIDFKKANIQRDNLIDKLQKKLSKKHLEELVLKTVEFKTEKISQKDFYAYILDKAKQKDMVLNDFPELQKYISYVSMYDAIDKTKTMDELDKLEDSIKEALFKDEKQKGLNKLSKNLTILKNIFNVTLTKDDYQYYIGNKESFSVTNYVSFINKEAPLYKITAQLDKNVTDIDRYREDVAKFYEYSFRRDSEFLKNIKFDQKQKIAVMVTGGFHTENLCEKFRKNGISYISIMPNFKNCDGYECPYFKLLNGEMAKIEKIVSSISMSPTQSLMAVAALSTALGKEVWGQRNIDVFKAWAGLQTIAVRDRWDINKVMTITRKDVNHLEITFEDTKKPIMIAINDLFHQAGEVIDAQMAKGEFFEIGSNDASRVRAIELAHQLGNDAEQGIDNLSKGALREGHKLYIQEGAGLPEGQNEHAGGWGVSIGRGLEGVKRTEAILHGIVAGFVEDHQVVSKIVKALIKGDVAEAKKLFAATDKHKIDGNVIALWDMTSIQRQAIASRRDFANTLARNLETAKPKILIVGGTFDDNGGAKSSIIAQMYTALPKGATVINGGYFNEIPRIVNSLDSYDVILWFPNIPNDKEKIRNIKDRYPHKYVVTSKRNHNNQYTLRDIVEHGRALKSNLVVEFSDTTPFNMRLVDPLGNVLEDTKAPETLTKAINAWARIITDIRRQEKPSGKEESAEHVYADYVKNAGRVFESFNKQKVKLNAIIVGGTFDSQGGKSSPLISELHSSFPEGVEVKNGGSLDELAEIINNLGSHEVIMWFPQVAEFKDARVIDIKQRYPFKTLIMAAFNPNKNLPFQQMINRALGVRSNLFVEFSGADNVKMRLYDPLSNQYADTTNPATLAQAIIGRLDTLRGFTRQGTVSIGNDLPIPDSNELETYFGIVRHYGAKFHDLIHPAEGVERFLGNTAFRASHVFPDDPKFKDVMFISQRNVDKRNLGREGFVGVRMDSYDSPRIAYYGDHKPSVDTPTQVRLLSKLPNVNYILHSHVYIEGAPFTNNMIPCGSVEEVEEVLATIGHDYSKTNFAINLLGHGSIIFARDLEYLGKSISYTARPTPEQLEGRKPSLYSQTLGDLFFSSFRAARNPIALKAIQDEELRDVSWEQLHEEVIKTAKGLIALGINRGDNVAILSEDREEFIYSDLAIHLIGATSVPIFPSHSSEQVRYILNDTNAKAVIVSNEKQSKKVIEVKDRLPKLKHIVAMEQLEALWIKGKAVTDAEVESRSRQVLPTDTATLTYTSGTTGEPKGVILTHANIISQVQGMSERLQLTSADVFLSYLPLAHMGGRSNAYASLYNNTPLAIPRGMDTESLMKDFQQIQPTVIFGTPSLVTRIYTHVQALIKAHDINPADTVKISSLVRSLFGGKLRYIQEGGAELDQDIIRFFDKHGIVVLEAYGLAETASGITYNTSDNRKIGTVGKPIEGIHIKIDPDTQEILVRGSTVMQGYLNKPNETSKSLRDGWFRTGDKGELADGFLKITGRIKDLIVTLGGTNVARKPIEDALLKSKYFNQVHLIGDGQKYITALVVPNMQELRVFAQEHGIFYNVYIGRDVEFVNHPEIQRLLWGIVAKVNQGIDQYERIRKIGILLTPFTVESGELGGLEKKNRNVIEEKRRDVIEQLYSEDSADVNVVVESMDTSQKQSRIEETRRQTSFEPVEPGYFESEEFAKEIMQFPDYALTDAMRQNPRQYIKLYRMGYYRKLLGLKGTGEPAYKNMEDYYDSNKSVKVYRIMFQGKVAGRMVVNEETKTVLEAFIFPPYVGNYFGDILLEHLKDKYGQFTMIIPAGVQFYNFCMKRGLKIAHSESIGALDLDIMRYGDMSADRLQSTKELFKSVFAVYAKAFLEDLSSGATAPEESNLYRNFPEVYDLLYQRFNKHQSDYLSLVQGNTPAGGSILDAAAGTGEVSVPLLQGGYQVLSTDLNSGMLEQLKKKAQSNGVKANTLVADFFAVSNLDDQFDTVTVRQAINYLIGEDNLRRGFAGFRKLLKPGGALVLNAPNYIPSSFSPSARGPSRVKMGTQNAIVWETNSIENHVLTHHQEAIIWDDSNRRDVRYYHDVNTFEMYTKDQFDRALREAGFTEIEFLSSQGKPYDTKDPVIYIIAKVGAKEPIGGEGLSQSGFVQRLRSVLEQNVSREVQHDKAITESGVILLLRQIGGKWHFLLTKRAQGISYEGLWALPGGRKEEGVDLSLKQVGLREFGEEMGAELKPENIIGALSHEDTSNGLYRIFPFVAIIDTPTEFQPNRNEVVDEAWIPLDQISADRFTMRRGSQEIVLEIGETGEATNRILKGFAAIVQLAKEANAGADAIGKFTDIESISVDAQGRLRGIIENIDTKERLDLSGIAQRRAPPTEIEEYIKNVEDLIKDTEMSQSQRAFLGQIIAAFRSNIPHNVIISQETKAGFFGTGKSDLLVINQTLLYNPLSFLHEMTEYLKHTHPQLIAQMEGLLDETGIAWLKQHEEKYIAQGRREYFLENKAHYVIRAFTRQIFEETDKNLTQRIKIRPEPISTIPVGSRIIEKFGKKLCVSPKAQDAMRKLDEFVAQREYVAEMAGYGLTKMFDYKTTVVVDFITPREGKIFDVKGLFLDQFVSGLMATLANSKKLSLTLKDNSIALISNDKQYSFTVEDFGWKSIKEYVEKLSSQSLPSEAEAVKTLLRERGEMALDTDWDFVVAGGSVWVTDNYLNRVSEEARKQNAVPNYTMHHHPQLGLAIAVMREKGLKERQDYYKTLLKASSNDMRHMKNAGAEWFEIRAMGTPENLSSETETTAEFYNIEYVDELSAPLKITVDELLNLSQDNAQPEKLVTLINRLTPLVEALVNAGYDIKTILDYMYGKNTVNKLKDKVDLPKDIFTLKDLAMYAIFARDDTARWLGEWLTPEVLNTHAQLHTHLLYHEIIRICQLDSDLRGKWYDYFTKNKLWDLPIETDIEKIKQGAELCKVFLISLGANPDAILLTPVALPIAHLDNIISLAKVDKPDRTELVNAMKEKLNALIGEDHSKGPTIIRSILSAISSLDRPVRNELEMALRTAIAIEGLSEITPVYINVVAQVAPIGQRNGAVSADRKIEGKLVRNYNGVAAKSFVGEGIQENDIEGLVNLITQVRDALDKSQEPSNARALLLLPAYLQGIIATASEKAGVSHEGKIDPRIRIQFVDQGDMPDLVTQFELGIEILEHVRNVEKDEKAEPSQRLLNLIAAMVDSNIDPYAILNELFKTILKIRRIDWRTVDEQRRAWEAVATAL